MQRYLRLYETANEAVGQEITLPCIVGVRNKEKKLGWFKNDGTYDTVIESGTTNAIETARYTIVNYNVTDTSTTTKLCYSSGFTSMEVDGTEVTFTTSYQFTTTGNHTVRFKLKDKTSIGNYAFESCTSLTSVTIPNSVTSIGDNAFSSCSSLTSITISNSVTSIGDSTFQNCKSLTSVTIPNSVTSIGTYAFSDCSSLTSVIIPNSVTSIGSQAFMGCTDLTYVTIGNGVTTIGDGTFYNCTSLTSITIPNSVTRIINGAFMLCNGLPSVTIPNSVTTIGASTFGNCSSLTSVTFNHTINELTVDLHAFQNVASKGNLYLKNSALKNNANLLHNFIGWDLYINGKFDSVISEGGGYYYYQTEDNEFTIETEVNNIDSTADRGFSVACSDSDYSLLSANTGATITCVTCKNGVCKNPDKELIILYSVTSPSEIKFYCSGGVTLFFTTKFSSGTEDIAIGDTVIFTFKKV